MKQTVPVGAKEVPMTSKPTIPVNQPEGQRLNGFGNMVMQYMQQELGSVEHKSDKARNIKCKMSMVIEGGVAVTVSFTGDQILVENGVCKSPDLHIKSTYLLMTEILCGKANAVMAMCKGKIKLLGFPKKPIQGLKVLGILQFDPNAEYVMEEVI
jgi:putative sterol carrier protein